METSTYTSPARIPAPAGVRIGTAGWSIPKDATLAFPGPGPHLERYARILNCAEINTTFYRLPRPSTWLRWSDSVPPDFRFSVKAPKAITHERSLSCDPQPLLEFLQAVRLLGDRLGPLLFQLPPKLAFDYEHAESFFDLLRTLHHGPVALEPRHPTWFTPTVSHLFSSHRIALVAADPPRHAVSEPVPPEPVPPLPEAGCPTPAGWPGLRYFRLHGSPRTYYSPYTPDFLSDLASQLPSATDAWVIFDNTASGAAIHNALTLRGLTHP